MVYLKLLSSIYHVLAAFTPYRLLRRREAEHDGIFKKKKQPFSSNSYHCFYAWLVKAGEFSLTAYVPAI